MSYCRACRVVLLLSCCRVCCVERQKLELASHTMLPSNFDKKSKWGNSPLPVLGFFAAYAGMWAFMAYRDRQSANMTFRVGTTNTHTHHHGQGTGHRAQTGWRRLTHGLRTADLTVCLFIRVPLPVPVPVPCARACALCARLGKARLATQFTAGLALTGFAWYKYRSEKRDQEERIKSYEHVRH
jgi:hypothetical protein